MNKCLVAFATTLLLTFSTITSAITLSDIQLLFSKKQVVRADFTQDRYINGLTSPIHSTGKMIISKELGLWWQQNTPFAMTLKMNQQRMEQCIEDQTPEIITAEKQPQLFQFNHLLTAIFTADKEMLENNFDITVTEQNNIWTLTLKPKLAPLNKIFKQIILSGKSYLEKVTINDMQNDKTELTFKNHKTTKLNQDEQLLFR
ncbi:outer membrane lipoprotein carrier protein LolA [Gilliamella sp. ESL0443]|uniref:outer membrane lipoprotein carrier protein LolA n=1 Tax=Gilliamella sp. ESL0443 TaxID=2704655 RepID=UPI001C69A4DF|nr:outer membrane lipoprotein carrier protein LolA [Gilliamella sp. ESL0443]QYN42522.1 outer membrane lipoprotein carrier protein LolA [Gilliamella sp. ESL0443]